MHFSYSHYSNLVILKHLHFFPKAVRCTVFSFILSLVVNLWRILTFLRCSKTWIYWTCCIGSVWIILTRRTTPFPHSNDSSSIQPNDSILHNQNYCHKISSNPLLFNQKQNTGVDKEILSWQFRILLLHRKHLYRVLPTSPNKGKIHYIRRLENWCK